MQIRTAHTLMALLALAGLGLAGTSASPKPSAPAVKAGVIQLRGVEIDRTKREIRFAVQVSQPEYLLEYFLCAGTGKGYESAFTTAARGQDIHAGLLLLGLQRGIPARRIDGKEIPPQGPELDLFLEWVAKDKSVHRINVLTLLNVKGGTPPKHWVFVGSDISPRGGYAADGEGGLISVCNISAAVIDLPVTSSRTMEGRVFGLNVAKFPKDASAMRMVIQPRKEAAKCPYARATLDVCANGAMTIDGQPIVMAKLEAWALKFTNRYPKAMVEIRTSAKALACIPLLAELELKLGGVFDAERTTFPPRGPILPRTPAEMASRMAQFKAKFATPEDELYPPADQARGEIAEIDRQLRELDRVRALWKAYRASLDAMAKAAPAPAKQPAENAK